MARRVGTRRWLGILPNVLPPDHLQIARLETLQNLSRTCLGRSEPQQSCRLERREQPRHELFLRPSGTWPMWRLARPANWPNVEYIDQSLSDQRKYQRRQAPSS